MPRSISLFIAPCLFVVLATAAHAECPQSTVSCTGKNGDVVVLEDTHTSESSTAHAAYGKTTAASYDRVDRTVTIVATTWWDEAYHQTARATVVEHYALQFVPSLAVTVRLNLVQINGTDSAGRTAWETANARLVVGGQEVTLFAANNSYLPPFIEFSTNVSAGVPLEVTYEVIGDAYGNEPQVQVTGHLEFVGIPEGLLTPCQEQVAVEPTTWGAVKSLYR